MFLHGAFCTASAANASVLLEGGGVPGGVAVAPLPPGCAGAVLAEPLAAAFTQAGGATVTAGSSS
jgi:hypothetical protein